ncbi:RNase A-like domain-containing protein [Pantoea agglomerans]
MSWQAGTVVSQGFRQGSATGLNAYAVRVVLHRNMFKGKLYYLLTSYPAL